MNRTAFLFLILLSFSGYAQRGNNFFKKNSSFWSKVEITLSEEAKTKQTSYFSDQDCEAYHFFHLNTDTFPDVIYQKEGHVKIFLFDKGAYKKIEEDKGSFSGIQQNTLFNVTTCHFISNDFSGNGKGFYQQWIILTKDSSLHVHKLAPIYFSEEIEIPDFLTINLKFRVKDQSDLLLNPSPSARKVIEYGMQSQGYAISSKIDDNNTIWWFVVMEPSGSNDEKMMGWMKSNNLRIVQR